MRDSRETPGEADREIEERFREIFDREMSPEERRRFLIIDKRYKNVDDPAA